MTTRLVSFTTCPYVQRALLAFHEKGVEPDVLYIDPADRPEWFWEKSPRGKVPLLLVGEATLFESQAICEYIEEVWPSPPLMPVDPVHRARDRAWFSYAGDELFVPLYKLVTSASPTRFQRASEQLERALTRLQAELGDGPWLSGDGSSFGMADLAIAPMFVRLALLRRRGTYRLPDSLAAVRDWGDRIMARPAMGASIPPSFEADLLASMQEAGAIAAGD